MKIFKLAGLFVAVVLVSSAGAPAQSLSDLARKERERQAKARAEGSKAKVYTEIPGDPSASKPDATTQTPDSSAPAGAAAQPQPSPASGGEANKRGMPQPQSAIATWPLRARATVRPSERAHRTVNVTIYVTSWCGYCRKAREFLARQPNVTVVAHDIEANRTRNTEMLSKTGGRSGVPVIDVEGMILHGYSAEALAEAISLARDR